MHQVKTQSSRRGAQAEMTSSKSSIKRKTASQEYYHENAKTNTKELGIFWSFTQNSSIKNSENLTTLLSELQKEFAELATSCRQTEYVYVIIT